MIISILSKHHKFKIKFIFFKLLISIKKSFKNKNLSVHMDMIFN